MIFTLSRSEEARPLVRLVWLVKWLFLEHDCSIFLKLRSSVSPRSCPGDC